MTSETHGRQSIASSITRMYAPRSRPTHGATLVWARLRHTHGQPSNSDALGIKHREHVHNLARATLGPASKLERRTLRIDSKTRRLPQASHSQSLCRHARPTHHPLLRTAAVDYQTCACNATLCAKEQAIVAATHESHPSSLVLECTCTLVLSQTARSSTQNVATASSSYGTHLSKSNSSNKSFRVCVKGGREVEDQNVVQTLRDKQHLHV